MRRSLHHRIASLILAALIVAAPVPAVTAQASSRQIGDDLGPGVTLDFSAQGEIIDALPRDAHLVVERIELDEGDALPAAEGPQILVNESGHLETVDDLGLTASLASGEHVFLTGGDAGDIHATEPTTVLRARIAAGADATGSIRSVAQSVPGSMVIDEDSCSPDVMRIGDDGLLLIENTTSAAQRISIDTLDFEIRIQPHMRRSFDVSTLPNGAYVAECGSASSSASSMPIVILVGDDASVDDVVLPEATPSPSSQAAESTPVTDVLFDLAIANAPRSPLAFSFSKLTVPAQTELGSIPFDGFTAIYPESQPLTITRSGRPASSLPAGTAVSLPDASAAEIANDGKASTVVYLAALFPPGDAGSTGSTGDDFRDEIASLESFLPSRDVMASHEYLYQASWAALDADTIWIGPYNMQIARESWVAGIAVNYSMRGAPFFTYLYIDRFESTAAAAAMLVSIDAVHQGRGDVKSDPPAYGADDVVRARYDYPELNQTVGLLFARFGDVIVTINTLEELGGDPFPQLSILWDLIAAEQS